MNRVYRGITRRLASALRITYAICLSSILGYLIKRSPRAHRFLASPLVEGPLKGKLIGNVQALIVSLERQELTEEDFISQVMQAMRSAILARDIDPWMPSKINRTSNVVLARCYGYAPRKQWHLKLHLMAAGDRHRIHAHKDVISAQVVAGGRLPRVRHLEA